MGTLNLIIRPPYIFSALPNIKMIALIVRIWYNNRDEAKRHHNLRV